MTYKPLNALALHIAVINRANGWFDTERAFGDEMALIHTEVSEAYEEYRKGKKVGERYYLPVGQVGGSEPIRYKPEGIPSELADILIRVLDVCHRAGIDIDEVVEEKLEYNKSRGYRHGGKIV